MSPKINLSPFSPHRSSGTGMPGGLSSEAEIASLEEEKKRLETLLDHPSSYAEGKTFQFNRELSLILEKLERMNGRWDRLTTTLSEKYPM